ncbi:glutamate synthase domain-containing protein 2 [Natronospira proteinivora]|uniref:Glutamate synthase domain-containing protein 2 n=1 Tax=Natronospira proteinivora TaxID=1807133 RepID=A0ABT1GAW1_9GAMM|nr:FMN-binding glutamate synthase family protein [Natronospira proteinivora]MCP1728458.1 glutamate synthase domain-containing protein 2 [Natronospira proteinivora]
MSAKTLILATLLAVTLLFLTLGLANPAWWWATLALIPLYLIAIHDLYQRRKTLLRNFPILGHGRYLIEDFRHHFRQYLIESDRDGHPFTHEQRALVYRRAKDVNDVLPFGTIQNVYGSDYDWLNHSMQPKPVQHTEPRVRIGGVDCLRPYEASHLNISALSFGSLSDRAIIALNRGAAKGGFYHNTGEGGLSPHHRKGDGDLVWNIGSGYFSCRREDGRFDPDQFRDKACTEQVRMIELKLSQGAKPGGGGILPASKLTRELAETRGVPMGEDVLSPAAHSEFSSPVGLLEFIARLRELSDGRPVGMKLCLGRRVEFMAVVKAMIETGIKPDFITIDGSEGGTGAASLELSNSVGVPLRDALVFVHNTLVGAGLRDEIRLVASGKVISAFDIARNLALGADLCNSARGMMFALGCIQARKCETNRCPTGVATQDPMRVNGISVPDKAERVYRYHQNTIKHLMELMAVTGLEHPGDFRPELFHHRLNERQVISYQDFYPWLEPEALCNGAADVPEWYAEPWQRAKADSFVCF